MRLLCFGAAPYQMRLIRAANRCVASLAIAVTPIGVGERYGLGGRGMAASLGRRRSGRKGTGRRVGLG